MEKLLAIANLMALGPICCCQQHHGGMGFFVADSNIGPLNGVLLEIANIALGGSALSSIDSGKRDHSVVVRSARDLGKLVRTRRKELGLSQEALSGITGLDRAFLSLFERGERGMSIDSAVRLVQALGMDIEIRPRRR
jgi:HTH-type transcriptional regulator / antitoxin HipB